MPARFLSPWFPLSLGLLCSLSASFSMAAEPLKVDPSTLTIIGYHEITDQKNALIPDYAVTPQQFRIRAFF
jgi:biofilm PGA synthesis lipoprotein PgaB